MSQQLTPKEKAKLVVFNYSNFKPDDDFPLVLVIERAIEEAVREERKRTIEECAGIAETHFPPVHTWASENSDLYDAQNKTAKQIARHIRQIDGTGTRE